MTSIQELAGLGYLPKELPTPFNSRTFGAALASAAPGSISGNSWRQPVTHNLARPGRIYRRLAVPHPMHFAQLATLIANDWAAISAMTNQSPLGLSTPVPDVSGRRAVVPRHRAGERAMRRATLAAGARFVVEADVSQFYPSIYTHSFEWVFAGKTAAKLNLLAKGPKTLGSHLDERVRLAQDGQTVGIPIGPDTSLVLAELVMSRVDLEFIALLPRAIRLGIRGTRYFDDYQLYARTRAEATTISATLQRVLADWQLTLNPYKYKILELPIDLDEPWVSVLKRIVLPTGNASAERSALVLLFDEAFRLARVYADQSVLAYTIGRFVATNFEERHVVDKANWALFEGLILQSSVAEVATLPRVAYLLAWYDRRGYPLNRSAISETLHSIIRSQADLTHGSEVAWAAWAAILLGVRLRAEAARSIEILDDDFVTVVALDANSRGLIPTLKNAQWSKYMDRSGLEGPHWLLAYEALHHGWLVSKSGRDFVHGSETFAWLRGRNVCFYDEKLAITPPAVTPGSVGPAPSAPAARRVDRKAIVTLLRELNILPTVAPPAGTTYGWADLDVAAEPSAGGEDYS